MWLLGFLIFLNVALGAAGWILYFRERRQRALAEMAVARWQKVFAEWKRTAEVWQESARVWKEASMVWREAAETYQRSSENWRELYLQQEDTSDDEELIN